MYYNTILFSIRIHICTDTPISEFDRFNRLLQRVGYTEFRETISNIIILKCYTYTYLPVA